MTSNRTILLRKPAPSDGAQVWRFIQETGTLDLNSAYCYIMLCDYFRDTCVIALREDQVVGFASAFPHPNHRDTLFVWQIGVAESARRLGLAFRMLEELLSREACHKVRYLEATVGPHNAASQGLFRRLAEHFGTEVRLSRGYPEAWFPSGTAHEEEMLLRLGPMRRNHKEEDRI